MSTGDGKKLLSPDTNLTKKYSVMTKYCILNAVSCDNIIV